MLQAEYAVRGELVIRANEHARAVKNGESRPFDSVVYCNIGNPQQLGQRPISFPRQVLSLCAYPDMLADPTISALFPEDTRERAKRYLDNIPGGSGAYSNSQGVDIVREEVADFIARRDGHPSTPDSVFLTDGASPAVQMILKGLIRGPEDGIMIPIPQYPLYSATIALAGGTQVDYFLNEDLQWGTEVRKNNRVQGDDDPVVACEPA